MTRRRVDSKGTKSSGSRQGERRGEDRRPAWKGRDGSGDDESLKREWEAVFA